jgi:hypothetical protein
VRSENPEIEKAIAEVRGRFTVTDLIEQTGDALDHGDRLFYAAKVPIEIVEQGEKHFIRWWRVRSGEKIYEVRRFKNFVWCECKSFFFSKRMCKHLAFTTGVYCERCRELSASVGKFCHDCDYIVNRFKEKL